MAGINKVHLVGRVGNDPETRNFNSGGQVAEFSLATSETWKDKSSGERKEKTQWHKIKVLNEGLIDNVIRRYVNKGDLVGVDGELQYEQWEKDGQKHTTAKIVITAFRGTLYLLGSKEDSQAGGNDRGGSRRDDRGSDSRSQSSGGGRPSSNTLLDDEIPFAPEWR